MKTVLLLLTSAAAIPLAGCTTGTERPEVEYYPPDESVQAAAQAGGFRLSFSSAARVGDILYLSGVIGTGSDGALPPKHRGADPPDHGQYRRHAEARRPPVRRRVQMHGDDRHMREWQAFNAVYMTYFKPDRLPARSALGANGRALGALVEVECLAHAPAR